MKMCNKDTLLLEACAEDGCVAKSKLFYGNYNSLRECLKVCEDFQQEILYQKAVIPTKF